MIRPTRSRNDQWERFDDATWRSVVNDSLDDQERAIGALGTKLDNINRVLVGILISLATGSILLAANLLLSK